MFDKKKTPMMILVAQGYYNCMALGFVVTTMFVTSESTLFLLGEQAMLGYVHYVTFKGRLLD